MLSRVVRPVARVAQRGTRKYHADDKPYKYASMDELPVPQGSWQANYDAYQKKYNMQLAAGIIIFSLTLAFAKGSGAIFLNAVPPTPSKKTEE